MIELPHFYATSVSHFLLCEIRPFSQLLRDNVSLCLFHNREIVDECEYIPDVERGMDELPSEEGVDDMEHPFERSEEVIAKLPSSECNKHIPSSI